MKRICLLLLLVIGTGKIHAQTDSLVNKTLPDCNCTVMMPKGATEFEKASTEDGSSLYINSYKNESGQTFGVIVINFKDKISSDSKALDDVLISYLDAMVVQFGIVELAGSVDNMKLDSEPSARGISDVWKDELGESYIVQGWINESKMSILYISTSGSFPTVEIENAFLDGFKFNVPSTPGPTNKKPPTKVIVGWGNPAAGG